MANCWTRITAPESFHCHSVTEHVRTPINGMTNLGGGDEVGGLRAWSKLDGNVDIGPTHQAGAVVEFDIL